jgi:hypothetical protein
MEADFLVAAGKPSPHGLGFVLRGRMAVAARLAMLCLALGLAGCQAVDNPANAAPTLSTGTTAKTSADPIVLAGAPPTTVTVGDPYYYAPTVSQGGGPISFSIQGQPAWLSFDTQTGALAGTPAAADVGVSGGIIITATNSVDTVSIGPFSIEIDPVPSPTPPPTPAPPTPGPATGSATLDWSPPTENADGSPLRNLAGYHVHYGTSDTSLTQTIDVADASATTYVVSGLTSGTYYFAVSAYNSLGLEGAWSNIAGKTL